jgi:uncharacterized protein with FMN-binding domain
MRRAPIVLTATAAGLAATLGFHAHARAPALPPTVTHSPSSRAGTSAGKTVTGEVVPTRYGNVQVQVNVSGGKLTAIQPLQLPFNEPKSAQISTYAEPLLRASGLSKQSADVDAVSGATYTTDGYRTALQSALDKAGFATAATAS